MTKPPQVSNCPRCGYPVNCLMHILGCTAAHATTDELESYVRHLLTSHNLWDSDGAYTFPDGVTLYRD